jgi:iron(III) transport system permease protein
VDPPARKSWILVAAILAGLLLATPWRVGGLLANTLQLGAGALSLALPLGALLGVLLGKVEIGGRRAIAALLLGGAFTPLYVQATAWEALLGGGGLLVGRSASGYAEPWLVGWRGAIWVHGMAGVPWVALLTAWALKSVERPLEEESLQDARAVRVLRRVSLRRGAAGLMAGAAWVAVACATEIGVTDLYQVRTSAEEVYVAASLGSLLPTAPGAMTPAGAPPAEESASAFSTGVALAVTIAVFAAASVAALAILSRLAPQAVAADDDDAWRLHPRHGGLLTALAWGVLSVAVLTPLVGLAWRAGVAVHPGEGGLERSWSAAKAVSLCAASPWQHRREWGWSLATGSLATLVVLAAGIPLAWIARTTGRRWLAAAAGVAVAVPAPLAGVATIALVNRPADSPLAFLGDWYDRTLLAPVLVQAWRALPLAGWWLWMQLATVPDDLLEAARSEGAGPVAQLWRIALPMRIGAVAGAATIALLLAVGELSATLLVAPPGVTTLSVRIFQMLHYGADDRVAALCLSATIVLLGGALATTLATGRIGKRRRTAMSSIEPPGTPSG